MKNMGWKYYGGDWHHFWWPWLLGLAFWLVITAFFIGCFNRPTILEYRGDYPAPLTIPAGSVQQSPGSPATGLIPCIPSNGLSATGCPGEIAGFLASLHGTYFDKDGKLKTDLQGRRNQESSIARILSRADPAPPAAGPSGSPAPLRFNWMKAHICTIDPQWGPNRPVVAAIAAAYEPCNAEYTDWALVRNDSGMSASVAVFITYLLLGVPLVVLIFAGFRSWKVRKAYRWLYLSQLP